MASEYTLAYVIGVLDQLWPESSAQNWDSVGLSAGVLDEKITKITFAVDASQHTVAEAIANDSQLLITHHPLLLRGINSIRADKYKGALLTQLVRAGVAHYAAHTNADVPKDGVSDIIAQKLSLRDTRPLEPSQDNPHSGIGRVGNLPEKLTLQEVAEKIAKILPPTVQGARVSGDPQKAIKTVALCGGAGDSLLYNQRVQAADVYVTSDLRHHPAQEFYEQSLIAQGPALIDISHWAAESLWLETAAQQVYAKLPGIGVHVSHHSTDPWHFSVGANSSLND